VREDQVQLPNGSITIYGVVDSRHDFIGVVPLLDGDTVLLVRQYRYIQGEVTWEIPTGAIEKGETPEQAAQRELQEEVEYRAGSLELVSIMRSNKAIMREVGYIFLAQELTPSSAKPDVTEDLERVEVPLDKALDMVHRHEITDCVSIIGLLLAGQRRSTL